MSDAAFKRHRLKHTVRLRKDRADDTASALRYVGLEHVGSGTGKLLDSTAEAPGDAAELSDTTAESTSNLFAPGDVLFGKLRPYLAKAFLADFRGRCSAELLVMRPTAFEPRFLRYVCLWRDFLDEVDGSTFGSKMPRADWESVGNVLVPVPSMPVQCAIADYLDRETARLDALVAAKERVMGLLAEERRSEITVAVTKGVGHRGATRDSGVPWMGDIPSHWEVTRLKYVGECIIGLTYNPSEIVDEAHGILVLRSSNVQDGRITYDDNVFVSASIPAGLVTRPGDILICSRNGSRALIGKNAMIDAGSSGVTFGAFMTILRSQHSAFLHCVLNSPVFDAQAGAYMSSTINQLTIEVLENLLIPMPPAGDRQAVVEQCALINKRYVSLSNAVGRSVALIKERRSALISAAVTGALQVT